MQRRKKKAYENCSKRINGLGGEKIKLEEQSEDDQVLCKILCLEFSEAKNKNDMLIEENNVLESRCFTVESLLKTKNLEPSEIKFQLQKIQNQTLNLSEVSSINIFPNEDEFLIIQEDDVSYNDASTNTCKCIMTDVSSNTDTEMKPPQYSRLHDTMFTDDEKLLSLFGTKEKDAEKKNIEKLLSIVIVELSSLQLLHSMFDLIIPSKARYCFNNDTFSFNHNDLCNEIEKNKKNKIFDKCNVEPREMNGTNNILLDPFTNTDSCDENSKNDRISLLLMEVSSQKAVIDAELFKISHEILRDTTLFINCNNCLLKRNLYSQLVQILSKPYASTTFNLENLDRLLNLILLDHSITGCLLALSCQSGTKDINKVLHQLCRFASSSEPCSNICQPQIIEPGIDEVDKVDECHYIYKTNLAILTDMSENEVNVDSRLNSDTDSESPKQRRRNFFCCMPLQSVKEKRKRKKHQEFLLKQT